MNRHKIFDWFSLNLFKANVDRRHLFSNINYVTVCFYCVTYMFIVNLHAVIAWTSKSFFLETDQEFQVTCTAQNTFSIKDFFSKRDQIRWKLRIWSHLLRKNLMENIIFWAVMDPRQQRKIMKTFICSQFRYYPLI